MASPKQIPNPRVTRPPQRKLLGRSTVAARTVAARTSVRKKKKGVWKQKSKMQISWGRRNSYLQGTRRRKRRIIIGSTKRTEHIKQGTKKVPNIEVKMSATTSALIPRAAIAASAKCRRTRAPLRPPVPEVKVRARHQRIKREVGKNDITGKNVIPRNIRT